MERLAMRATISLRAIWMEARSSMRGSGMGSCWRLGCGGTAGGVVVVAELLVAQGDGAAAGSADAEVAAVEAGFFGCGLGLCGFGARHDGTPLPPV